jgi:hypothetical protein
MMLPLLFMCPPAYFAHRMAACMRHSMVGMHPMQHFALMRAFYPL